MSSNNRRDLGRAPWLHVVLSTGFSIGFVPLAPGTAAALLALGIWWTGYECLDQTTLLWTTIVVTIAVTLIGVWTSDVMERYWGKDPRAVVIDEFIGVWIPCLAAPCGEKTWIMAVLGFAAFRIIDIFKPLGCRWVEEHVEGGWGVMLDDALAGAYALAIVLAAKTFV